jgi:FrmR/RcnR family transcriptional regulator, repressor of frmRAB operon
MGSSAVSAADLEKVKLRRRLGRIRGQVEAIQRALDEDASCASLLQQATACRGALEGFIAEVIEDHIREHLVQEKDRTQANKAAEELIEIVHSYLT